MRWLLALLLVLLGALQLRFWFGDGGVGDQRRLEQRVAEQARTRG